MNIILLSYTVILLFSRKKKESRGLKLIMCLI